MKGLLPKMQYIPAKTIVTRTKSTQWFGASYNMNIYRGCCHGCIYCDSRSSCYGIQTFDQVGIKDNALEIIRNDLRRKIRPGIVSTGSMSDPYNPFEKELELTRHAMELLAAYGFGTAIATKSELILRDIPILQEISEQSPAVCKITITTCDDSLSKKIEPGVPVSSRRFEVVEELSRAGLFTGILLMPVLPFLEDTEANILGIVARAAKAGAKFIYPAFGMTLRQNQREYYLDKLEEIFPGKGLAAQYRKHFGMAYECASPLAGKLWKTFSAACNKEGILCRMPDIIKASHLGYEEEQLRFF